MMLLLSKEWYRVVPVLGLEGEETGTKELPPLFAVPVRKDLIRRAFLAEFTAHLQPQGRDPLAGKRTSARSLGVGRGLARIPRIRGTGRGALVTSAVGGRRAHPPRVDKVIVERINKKERALATASAIAATGIRELVVARGHVFEAKELPIVIDSSLLDKIRSAKEAREFLKKIGVYPDIERAKERTRVRAGKGKMRGRRYITPRSVLFVLEDHKSPLALSVRNFPGVEVVTPTLVSVLHLAPGGVPGRLTVYTTGSLDMLWERFKDKLNVVVTG